MVNSINSQVNVQSGLGQGGVYLVKKAGVLLPDITFKMMLLNTEQGDFFTSCFKAQRNTKLLLLFTFDDISSLQTFSPIDAGLFKC